MITNIKTGFDEQRKKDKKNPFYCTWKDNGMQYYAYFCFSWRAQDYADRMADEICHTT